MRKDVREFIRRLEAAGLTVEPTPGHYRVMRDGKPLRKANGMPFMLPFSRHDPLAQSRDRRAAQARDRAVARSCPTTRAVPTPTTARPRRCDTGLEGLARC